MVEDQNGVEALNPENGAADGSAKSGDGTLRPETWQFLQSR